MGARRLHRLDAAVRAGPARRAARRASPARLTFILFAIFRAIYGALGCATPSRDPGLSRLARPGAAARVAALSALSSSFGLGTIIGPALAPLFVLPFVGLPGPLFAFAADRPAGLRRDPARGFPTTRLGRQRRARRGDELSVARHARRPARASSPRPRRGSAALKWNDPRIRAWIIAGVVAGHAQAATLTCLGFFVIDRLHLAPQGSEGPIAIVMMAGASATLAAQWGLIPRLAPRPAGADPVGRADRRRRADLGRCSPTTFTGSRIGFALASTRLRLHPAGLHRRRVARRPAGRAGRSRRRDHKVPGLVLEKYFSISRKILFRKK